MDKAIAYAIAGLSTVSLLLLWFISTYKVLLCRRNAVCKAQEELRLHEDGYREKFGGAEEHTAKHMMETSTLIYAQITAAYNKSLRKPIHRLPGFVMGFKSII